MNTNQESELFDRVLRLRDAVQVLKGTDADAVNATRRELHELRKMAAGLEYNGRTSMRKILIARPADLDSELADDWRALVATLKQKGIGWLS